MSRAPGARIGIEIAGPSGELFTLTDFLGQGNFGEVYLAAGQVSGLTVAVKLLPTGGISGAARDALLNEMRLATQIVHPNVVQVLHADEGASSQVGPYMIMEFVTGETLEGILETIRDENRVVSLDEARSMMTDIAQGAKAINEKLIHRDIKPDNILHDGSRLKISDFGISKIIGERTRTHTFKGVGAIRYLAPEGWEYEKNTEKMDVYSVGLVFYEILTLQHPLERYVTDKGDWKAWERVHRYTDCPDVRTLRKDVDTGLSQLLERMLAKRPVERPIWEEVLNHLQNQPQTPAGSNPVSGAVEIALRIHRENYERRLKEAEERERETKKLESYLYSIRKIISLFDRIVEGFNADFQHGKVMKQGAHPGYRFKYLLPVGGEITFDFFPPPKQPVPTREGQLIGGGYVSTDNGVSANLLLLTIPEDDYGAWKAALFKFHSLLSDVQAVARKKGLSHIKYEPFGFDHSNQFYDEAREIISNTMYTFTYNIVEDIQKFLTDVFETAVSRRTK